MTEQQDMTEGVGDGDRGHLEPPDSSSVLSPLLPQPPLSSSSFRSILSDIWFASVAAEASKRSSCAGFGGADGSIGGGGPDGRGGGSKSPDRKRLLRELCELVEASLSVSLTLSCPV